MTWERCTIVAARAVAGGPWTEKVLFSFSGTDGSSPFGRLLDANGTLYDRLSEFGGITLGCDLHLFHRIQRRIDHDNAFQRVAGFRAIQLERGAAEMLPV